MTDKGKPKPPQQGDARVHNTRKVVFYVRASFPAGTHINVSTSPERGRVQTVTVEDWFAKTSPTCNRPICEACAVRVGDLDYCPPHARAK